ncbi:MAG: hypothetical protein HON43_02810 [Alphaproteobacteria bacterium]|jgi:hypothetical protein|nr:hypothetical protein [Alphaproteobacteria bacterium]MBT5390393.1 hypothetical protein [Alphaproteobacteria bacterium]
MLTKLFNFRKFSGARSKSYIVLNISVLVLVLFLVIFELYHTQKTVSLEMEKASKSGAIIIKERLTETFKETEEALNSLDDQIISDSPLKQILQKLSLFEVFHHVLSWTSLDWIGMDGRAYGNSEIGVYKVPISRHKKRGYLENCRKTPGKLFLSTPDYGIPSGNWIIPGGYGIRDENSNFLGILSFGFNIPQLIHKLWFSDDFTTNVLILSQEGKVFLDFSNSKNSGLISFPTKKLVTSNTHSLSSPIDFKGYRYVYKEDIILDGSFILLSGYSIGAYNDQYKEKIFPSLIVLFLALIIFYFFLYLYKAKFFTFVRSVERKRTKHHTDINRNLEAFAQKISKDVDSVIKNISMHQPCNSSVETLNKIKANLSHLVFYSSSDVSYVNIDSLIDDCITLKSQEFFLKNFSVQKDIDIQAPLYLNPSCLKHIILSLFSLILKTNPENGRVQILAQITKENSEEIFELHISDRGFGFAEEDLKSFLKDSTGRLDDSLSISQIRKITSFQGGSLEIKGVWNNGTTYLLKFPIQNLESLMDSQNAKDNNIIPFEQNKDNVVNN